MKKNKSLYKNRLNKTLLIVIAIGLFISTVMPIIYYADIIPGVGIRDCSVSTAANCGDGDFGGVIFWFIGIPLTLIALAALCASLLMGRLHIRFTDNWALLKFIALTIFFIVLASLILGFVESALIPADEQIITEDPSLDQRDPYLSN